jgi:hypothetical protein
MIAVGSIENADARKGGVMNRVWRSALRQFVFTAVAVGAILVAVGLRGTGAVVDVQSPASGARAQPIAMPSYDSSGALRLPDGYRQWVLAGTSMGLSYAERAAAGMGMEMFNETLIEPSAYQHFVETGTFREGTMLVLILHGIGENALPARRGRFATDVHGVEMAVKDSSHRPEGWAYYNFGGMTGIRSTAQAMPKDSCYTCHKEHAKRDNVFMQYYSLLSAAAPRPASRP